MDQGALFFLGKDTIDIDGLDNLMKFTRFKPNNSKIFLGPFESAEDLKTKSGVILLKKGCLISHDHVARLKSIQKLHPDLDLYFEIKRNSKLHNELRKYIVGRMAELLKKNQQTKGFQNLLSGINNNFNTSINEILKDDNITLAVHHMWSVCESSKKGSINFINHSINTAIFSLAIALSKKYKNTVKIDSAKLLEIIKASLFLSYGALIQIDNILKNPAEMRTKLFWDSNRKGYSRLIDLQFDFDTLDAIRLVCEYHHGRKDFVQRDEWLATMANIILVAEDFLQEANGLFIDPIPVKQAVDKLNVRAFGKDLNNTTVEALTLALNQEDIFDFYRMLDCLLEECPYEAAYPYPLTGYRSPCIFVCINSVPECKELEKSIKAVYLVRQLGELLPGKYHRCSLLTPKLLIFYDQHYEEIKGAVVEKVKSCPVETGQLGHSERSGRDDKETEGEPSGGIQDEGGIG